MRSPYSGSTNLRSTPRSFYPPSSPGPRSVYGPSYGGLRVAPGRPRGVIYPRARAPWISPLYPFPFFYNYSFLDPFWGFDDNFLYSGTQASYAGPDGYAYAGQPSYSYPTQPAYPAQPSDGYAPQPADDNGPMVYAPDPSSQQAQVPTTDFSPYQPEEEVITVFFKDRRPPEQIRNYVLTRSALLIPGARMREIPLDQIDLSTTQRVNGALGIDFHLPEPN